MVSAFTAGLLSGTGDILKDQRRAEAEADLARGLAQEKFGRDKELLLDKTDASIKINKADAKDKAEQKLRIFNEKDKIFRAELEGEEAREDTFQDEDTGEEDLVGAAGRKAKPTPNFKDMVEQKRRADKLLQIFGNDPDFKVRAESARRTAVEAIQAVQSVVAATKEFTDALTLDIKNSIPDLGARTKSLDSSFKISTASERADLSTLAIISRNFIEKRAVTSPESALISAGPEARKLVTDVFRVLKLRPAQAAAGDSTPVFTKDTEGRIIPNPKYFALLSKVEVVKKVISIDNIIGGLRDKDFNTIDIKQILTPDVFDKFSAFSAINKSGAHKNIKEVQKVNEQRVKALDEINKLTGN